MPFLTGIDVLGVQRFVFASNRLKDVVTGSFLVHWSTSWPGALSGLVEENSILLAGGGNAIVEFNTMPDAKVFAARYTRLLHEEAPGLEVVLVHEEFEIGKLAVALQNLQFKLARAKTEWLPSVPLSGLSVTATCMETGLPATRVDRDEKTVQISRNIFKRRETKAEANGYWEKYLEDKTCYDFPRELDNLGRDKGDTSLIGIVHVDGNGVGKKIKVWLEKVVSQSDDTVRKEYKEWSKAIDQLGQEALQAAVDRIFQSVERSSAGKKNKVIGGTPARLGFTLTEDNDRGRWLLPIRPILLGGDDLTFVCDGRIALDLAETALCEFEHSDIPHLGNITASAGIAIVRVHSPFARGYELAEKLCRSAKGKLKEENDPGCALDWHIGIARPGESVTDIRKRQYMANSVELTCRPYRLDIGKGDNKETWRWLSKMLLEDNNCGLRGNVWSERRNKVKALGELVREGPDGVLSALKAWRVVENKLQLPIPIENDGFIGGRTPLLDAVEIVDLHLVLGDAVMTKTVEEKLP